MWRNSEDLDSVPSRHDFDNADALLASEGMYVHGHIYDAHKWRVNLKM